MNAEPEKSDGDETTYFYPSADTDQDCFSVTISHEVLLVDSDGSWEVVAYEDGDSFSGRYEWTGAVLEMGANEPLEESDEPTIVPVPKKNETDS